MDIKPHAWGSHDGYWVRHEDKALRPDAELFRHAFYDADTIEHLRAQVAALEQDAKRYRWLRDKFTRIGVSAWPDCDDATDGPAVVRELRVMEHFRPTDAASTDAAIDAAMG